MFSFKKSLISLIGLLVIVGMLAALMPLVSRGQGGNPVTRDPRKSYYLTRTEHNGSQALSACASGYHMASLWEILDPSNLKYETTLGFTTDDSGSGPPTIGGIGPTYGWVRTGRTSSSSSSIPGVSNCDAWTSADPLSFGMVVRLPGVWTIPESPISPWDPAVDVCSSMSQVWCVQN